MKRVLTLGLAGLALSSAPALAGWEVTDANLGTIAMGVDFLDAQTGYVAGAQNGSGPAIWKSTDGGDTFRVASNELLSMMYMDIAFSDPNVGVAGGMGMFHYFAGGARTEDGGRTWKRTANDWMFFVTQNVVSVEGGFFAMPGSWGNLRTYSDGLAISRNGGESWDYYDWGIDTWPRYASFASSEVGWVSGGHWPAELMRTSSGSMPVGEHFSMPLPEGRRMPTGWRTNDTGYRGVVAKTSDGGRTYAVQLDVDGVYFNGIQFTDDQNGWVVGEGGSSAVIYHTADGGRTWDLQWEGAGASLLTLRMADALVGWAGGADLSNALRPTTLLLETRDGGRTWTEVDEDQSFYLFDMDVEGRELGWAVGYNFENGQCGVMQYVAE